MKLPNIILPNKKESYNKYGNRKCVFNGIEFDSQLEYECYLWLKSWTKNILVHHKVDLIVNKKKICSVMPDFVIYLNSIQAGQLGDFYIDSKGMSQGANGGGTYTSTARIKYKLFEALHGKKIYLYPAETHLITQNLIQFGFNRNC